MVRLMCFLAVFTVACNNVQCQSTRRTELILNRRINILERDVGNLKEKNKELEKMFRKMNATLFSMAAAFSTSQQSNVANLTLRMDVVEANIDTIVDQAGIDLEDTELNRFLGNAEAQLVDLQMDPDFEAVDIPTIPPETEDLPVDQSDLLGNALFALNRQSEKLSSQVAELQQEVGRDQNTASSARQPETDQLENRLNQLERLVVAQTVNEQGSRDSISRPIGGSGVMLSASSHAGQTVAQTTPLTTEEQEALRGILQDARGGAVSMFSFARTGSLLGTVGVPQSIPYETQLTSKGGMFERTNGTFICQIPGYYFITFTARTYDHKYLGLNLMKNDDSLTAVFSDKHGRNVMQTQSIIIHLAVNDRLWLRLPGSYKFAMHSDQYHMTTFTGFLLYQGEP